MYHRMLVPLDSSELAATAVPTAERIAKAGGSEVHLIHVLGGLLEFPGKLPQDEIAWQQRGRQLASEYLQRHAQAFQELEGVDVVTRVIRSPGPTAEALTDYAAEHGIDLIVMTSHGEGGLRRLWLGSVADGLLRRTPASILLLRPDDGVPGLAAESGTEVLVPLDGSPDAEAVLDHALVLAESFDLAITLLRVVSPGGGLGGFRADPAAAEREGLTEAARQQALEYLESVADELRSCSERELEIEVEVVGREQPADGILERAQTVDLVALATHGRGGFKRLVLGSVADKVVRGGSTPVLAVPIPGGE